MRETERIDAPPPRPSLARAIREAFSRYLEDIVVFLLVNLGWVLAFGAFAFVRIGLPLVVILTPLLALPTSALMRLAVASGRDRTPTWPMARDELGRLAGRKVALAAIQLLVMGLSLTNVLAFVDILLLPDWDLYASRLVTGLLSVTVLLFGMIWERR